MSVAASWLGPSSIGWSLCLLLACGSSPPTPARTAKSQPKDAPSTAAPETGPDESRESSAAWDTLVEQGNVWARPELDRYCDDGGRAYFVRSVPSATYDGSGGPSGFGCEARFTGTLVEVGGADPPCGAVDVVGQTFCCPPSLLAPSAPASGNGPTCRQILYDYLEEQGVDPRVKNPELAGAKGPSFDASTSVLARGNLIDQCDVDPHAVVEVCAAVRNGAAQGVSVCVQPSDAGAAQCIARAVRALGFPKRERMDFTETAFDPRGKR